jgi:hypothetical protein
MRRTIRLSLAALFALALGPGSVRAEHARIELKVVRLDAGTGRVLGEARAAADTDPPAGGLTPRPLLKVKAGEPLVLQFFFTNTYPHGVRKDVVVHYFVVREQKPRQKELPDLRRGVVTEGKFTLDFKPQGRVGARLAFTVRTPGVYLVRVHSVNTQSDHEHFSALDLKVE